MSFTGRGVFAASALVSALLCHPAIAHDFWIEPASFRPEPGRLLTIGLRVGDHFDGVPYARNPRHVRRFELLGPRGASEVPGLAGRDPAGFVHLGDAGLYLLGYWSTHTLLELPADRFEASLKNEGLEHIVRQRAVAGDGDQPAIEAFYRCAKALLRAGEGGEDGYDRIFGFPLELVPERNPYRLRPGDTLPLRVLYRGGPAPNLRVVGMNAGAPEAAIVRRSDADGRIELPLDRPGMWLIKAVHMVPAPAVLPADWESAWASLTFELPES